jgi:DNA-binding NtrC family response regulator
MTDESPTEGRILVLDDEPMVTRTLEILLRAESPWETFVFNRVSDAVSSLSEHDYHVVISDFLMPEMDGVKFLSLVRETQPFASRILLTGYADKQNAIRSINEANLFHYIEKPWDNDALLLVLRNGVERSRLLSSLDDKVRMLAERDQSLETLRSGLLKTIL